MPFNSFEFWAFFCVVYCLYRCLGRVSQNCLLLAASYLFYAAWDWRFLSLLWVSTAVDFTVGRALAATEAPGRRKLLLLISLATNLGILGFFKYAGFFVESMSELMATFGVRTDPFTLRVILPIGISFYTFQTLSYTIDVYRRSLEPTRDPLDFALFVAFFPQLVAGPIERAKHMLPQFAEPRRIESAQWQSGLWLAVWGLYKKVVIADNLATLVDAVYRPGVEPGGVEIWGATVAFAIQVYCDFSGYTDIARGTARMFGIELMRNFDVPYVATSPTDFWRRWHISLSTWLRDYLYIPLGGNRRGPRRTQVNLLLTMLLGGLWHGAAWNFVLWGGYHGMLLVVHRQLRPWLDRFHPRSALGRNAWTLLRVIVVFHLVCLGWLFFRADDLGQIGSLLSSLLGGFSLAGSAGSVGPWLFPFAVLTLPLFVVQAAQVATGDPEPIGRLPGVARSGTYAVILAGLVLLGEHGGQPFIYFQF